MELEIFKPLDSYDVVKYARLTRPMNVIIEAYATLKVSTETDIGKVIPYQTTDSLPVIRKNVYSLCFYGQALTNEQSYTPPNGWKTQWSFETVELETGLNIFLKRETVSDVTSLYLCADSDVLSKLVIRTVDVGATCDIETLNGSPMSELKIVRDDGDYLRPSSTQSVSESFSMAYPVNE